jgi:hypothetical protein
MKKWMMAAAVAVAGLAAADARAQAPTYVPGNGSCPPGANCPPAAAPAPVSYGAPVQSGGKHGYHIWTKGGLLSIFGGSQVSRMPTLPVYMAAPWYLYWPYDGHFQTVAPMAHGLYYPPPLYTGNPYLPGAYPGYVPGNPVPAVPVSPVRP